MTASDLINLSGLIDDAKCFTLVRQHRWLEGARCAVCERKATVTEREGEDFAACVRSSSGWDDYHKVRRELAISHDFVYITVKELYSDIGLDKQWYQSPEMQKVLRLVEPDPPFKGLWQPVRIDCLRMR